MKPPCNQCGAVAVIASMFLALLSLLGIAATHTAMIELQIAANDREYKKHVHLAEAAAIEGVQILANASEAQIEDGSLPGLVSGIDMSRPSSWSNPDNRAISRVHPNAAYAIVNNGIAQGESEANLRYDFIVFGRYSDNNGLVMIVIGFRKTLQQLDFNHPMEPDGVYFWQEHNPNTP